MATSLNGLTFKTPLLQKYDFFGKMKLGYDEMNSTLKKAWSAVASFFERIGVLLASLPDKILNPKVSRKRNNSLNNYKLPNGIPNLGNTCYMGACVQAIARNEALVQMFRDSKCEKPIKKKLLDLVDAIKNPSVNRSTVLHFTKEFKKSLDESGWQKGDKRPKGFQTADSEELLRHLQEAMKITKMPMIVSTISQIVHIDYRTNKTVDSKIEKGRANDGVYVTLDKDTPTVQAYFDRQIKGERLETVHEMSSDGNVTMQVEEREVLWSKVRGIKNPTEKEKFSKLFKYNDKKDSFGAPSVLFSKGSLNYKKLMNYFGGEYKDLEKEYCTNRPEVNFCRQMKIGKEVIDSRSTMLKVTIQNPTKSFIPDKSIKINGLEFNLSGIVKRLNGNHYTYCSRNMIGECVDYDDQTVKRVENPQFARILFYEKVEKLTNYSCNKKVDDLASPHPLSKPVRQFW
jgi:hypothetical protein